MPTAIIIATVAGLIANGVWAVFNFLARKAAQQVESGLKEVIHKEIESLKQHMETKYYDRDLLDEKHKNFESRLTALELHASHRHA